MRFTLLTLFALAAVAHAKNIDLEDVITLEDNSAYNYINRVAIPLAESRIVGGQAAAEGQFPYMASLLIHRHDRVGLSTGVIISHHRILTAAHNWHDGHAQAREMEAILGSTTVFGDHNSVHVNASRVVVHEHWYPRLVRNDIAMIILEKALEFTTHIAAVALPSGTELKDEFVGKRAILAGYGITSNHTTAPQHRVLHYANATVISNAECHRWSGFVQHSNLCISGAQGVQPCSGDGGAPLVSSGVNRTILIGIASFGSGHGCDTKEPSAFTRVTYYHQWIDHHMHHPGNHTLI